MDDQRIEEIAGTPDAEDLVRYCPCADPENCTESVPGYVCRKTSYAHRFGLFQSRIQAIAVKHARLRGHVASSSAVLVAVDAIREALSSQEEELRKLTQDRDLLKLEYEGYIEREATHCPEDVGFDEFIPVLRAKIATLEEELRSLREERDMERKKRVDADRLNDEALVLAINQRNAAEDRAESAEAELQRLREENVRLRSLQAKACSCVCHEDGVAAILKFYVDVNARAEAEMLNGKPVTGAHYRALEAEIVPYRQKAS
jgi:chromosome segregation ATPase